MAFVASYFSMGGVGRLPDVHGTAFYDTFMLLLEYFNGKMGR
jgi:hypothetical protein